MSTKRRSNRVSLFAQILQSAGHPLHFTDIYQQAIAQLPSEQAFTREETYASLFYHRDFRALGKGIFALASWQTNQQKMVNGQAFDRCPPPLLGANNQPRSFLMRQGIDLLIPNIPAKLDI